MNYLQKLNILSIFLLALIGCSESDEFENLNEFSDVFFENSEVRSYNRLGAEVGEAITFLDLSQFPLSHEWIIDEKARFIRNYEDKDSLNLNSFIIPNSGNISNDKRVNVLFTNKGESILRLRNTFKDSVTYIPPIRKREEDTIRSTFVDGVWLFDQPIIVNVFDPVNAEFTVSKNDNVILNVAANDRPNIADSNTFKVIEVESGESLVFTDITTIGDPTRRTWLLNEADLDEDNNEDNQEEVEVTYFALGEFLAGSIQVDRFNSFKSGQDVKVIPLIVKVIPSSSPFVPVDIAEATSASTIKIKTTASIDQIGDDFSAFSINATNTNQSTFNINITNISIDPDSSNTLVLELSERIYEDDIIEISYTSDGTITSLDNRELQSFSGVEVAISELGSNLLDPFYYGFESAGDGWFIQHPNIISIGTERSFSGDYSIRFETDGVSFARASGGGTIPEALITTEGGTFNISMQVWLDPSQTPSSITLTLRDGFQNVNLDFSGLPTGEWVEFTQVADFDPVSGSQLRLQAFANSGSEGILFLDDITLRRIENRP